MKILQVNKYFSPDIGGERRVGGVEKVVQQISEGLANKDVDTRVLASHHTFHPQSSRVCRGTLEILRIGTLGFVFNTPVSPYFLFAYRTQAQWADVAHFHVPSPLAELSHFLFGAPEKTKIVVTFHADPSNTRLGYLSPLYRPILQKLLDRADRIVVTAPANSRAPVLEEHGQKCQVIPLAADLQNGSISNEDVVQLQRKLKCSRQEVILYVGRLVYYKGLDYLLEAVKQIDAQLIVVGKGNERDRLEQKAQELGVKHRVHFAGYVPDDKLPIYYSMADLFVLPSISPAEAFGIVQVEAMSHGVPVINTDLPTGVPFVSPHEQTGLTVPPRDSRELANSINTLIEDSEMRNRFAQNARQRARKFTVENMVNNYLNVYSSILS